jgi:hypothetical protein
MNYLPKSNHGTPFAIFFPENQSRHMPEILKLHDTNFEIVCFCGLELLLKTTALKA